MSLLVTLIAYITGQLDIKLSLIDINILSDSQFMVMFTRNNMEQLEASLLINQLVFNIGLDQFQLSSKPIPHSEFLKLMKKQCYLLKFILISSI